MGIPSKSFNMCNIYLPNPYISIDTLKREKHSGDAPHLRPQPICFQEHSNNSLVFNILRLMSRPKSNALKILRKNDIGGVAAVWTRSSAPCSRTPYGSLLIRGCIDSRRLGFHLWM